MFTSLVLSPHVYLILLAIDSVSFTKLSVHDPIGISRLVLFPKQLKSDSLPAHLSMNIFHVGLWFVLPWLFLYRRIDL